MTSTRVVGQDLELSSEQMRELLELAGRMVVDYLSHMDQKPAVPREDASDFEPMPELGAHAEQLLDEVRRTVIEPSVNTASGSYQAYIPGGGLFASAVAHFIASATNRYVGVTGIAPGAVRIEQTVIRWLSSLVGYDDKALGFLTSGGSLANFSALVTARCDRLPENFLAGTIYVSDQVHSSIQKAATLAGFPSRNIRVIPSDSNLRLPIAPLCEQIHDDRRAGYTPFLIIGSAGTTNTGAIDPLPELAEVAAREKMWLHVDAAYGGFFLLTNRGRSRLAGIERADSVTVDPHKGLFLPYGTGCLLVRDGNTLRRVHREAADYLQDIAEHAHDFSKYSPELSRPFRGLGIWLPFKLCGVAQFRKYLDEKLDLAVWACDQLRDIPGIEIVSAPELSVVAFRLKRAGADLDQLNQELLSRIKATGQTYLSSTVIRGQFVLRVAILCFRTHKSDVERTITAIRQAVISLQ